MLPSLNRRIASAARSNRKSRNAVSRPRWKPSVELLEDRSVPAVGTWQQLVNLAPNGGGTMLLQTDGTVLVSSGFDSIDRQWFRLTPDANGSYVKGTWSQIPSMRDTRLFDYSGILRDGRMFVAGGEYGTGGDTAEIYDPVSNTWSVTSREPFGDLGDIQGMVL